MVDLVELRAHLLAQGRQSFRVHLMLARRRPQCEQPRLRRFQRRGRIGARIARKFDGASRFASLDQRPFKTFAGRTDAHGKFAVRAFARQPRRRQGP